MGKSGGITGTLPSLRSKRFHASSSRTSGREQKQEMTSCQFTNEPNREISRGVFQIRGLAGKRFLFSPPPLLSTFFVLPPSNFPSMTRLETLAMQASYRVVVKALSHVFYKTTEIKMFAYPYEWVEMVYLKVTIASSDHRLSSLCHLIIVSDTILTLGQTTLRRNLRQTNV